MILLSPEEIMHEIEYVLEHNDLPLATLVDPLAKSISKAQAKKDAQENAGAIIDYSEGRITVQRLAERLGVSVYDLYAALNKYAKEGIQ